MYFYKTFLFSTCLPTNVHYFHFCSLKRYPLYGLFLFPYSIILFSLISFLTFSLNILSSLQLQTFPTFLRSIFIISFLLVIYHSLPYFHYYFLLIFLLSILILPVFLIIYIVFFPFYVSRYVLLLFNMPDFLLLIYFFILIFHKFPVLAAAPDSFF